MEYPNEIAGMELEPVGTKPQVGDRVLRVFNGTVFSITRAEKAKEAGVVRLYPDDTAASYYYADELCYPASYRILKRTASKKLEESKPMLGRIYIAGPMTGLPNFNFDAFNQAAEVLAKEGDYDVFNPAQSFNGDQSLTRAEYFRKDCAELAKCTHICLLPGWYKSAGAIAEATMAIQLELKFLYLVAPDQNSTTKFHPFTVPASAEAVSIVIASYWRHREEAKSQPGPSTDQPGPLASETILEEAARLTSGDRQQSYGHPLDDYMATGTKWGATLHKWAKESAASPRPIPVPPRLAMLCMVDVKTVRETNRPKRDNLVDGAGYLRCIEMADEEMSRRGLTDSRD